QHWIGTGVLDDREPVRLDGAVSSPADLDLLLLASAVAKGDHRLRPCLRPLDRSADFLGDPAKEQGLGIRLTLCAEGTADIRGDDTDAVRAQAEDARHGVALEMRILRRYVIGDAIRPLPDRGRGSDLHGAGRHTVVDDPSADDDVA